MEKPIKALSDRLDSVHWPAVGMPIDMAPQRNQVYIEHTEKGSSLIVYSDKLDRYFELPMIEIAGQDR